MLGVSDTKPYFVVKERQVFYMFDVPHLLKSTRNNFFRYAFEVCGGVTNQKYIETFYDSQPVNIPH